jgi:predicted RND superfamily exporter protein
MNSLVKWLAARPVTCTLIVVILTVFFARQLPNLHVDTSANGLIVQDSPETLFYEEVKQTFGDDTTLTILYESADVFTQPILQSIEDLTLAVEQIDGVSRVLSLSTINNLKGSDGFLDTETLIPYVPEDPGEIKQIRKDALGNVLNIGEVVNADGTTAAIQLSVENREGETTFDKRLVAEIASLVNTQSELLGEQARVYQVGSPLVKATILEYITEDLILLTPLSVLVVGLVLFLFFRSSGAIVLPIVTGVISVVVSLGFMALVGYAFNPISIIIPALLLVIGSTEDIHLLSEYATAVRSKMEKRAAIERMAVRSGLVILLTSVTTVVGFLTIVPNEIPILREFAIAASFGITANFLITVLLAPPILRVLGVPKSFKRPEPAFMDDLKDKLVYWSIHKRKSVFSVFGTLALVAVVGSSLLHVDTNYLLFFKKDAPIRQAFRDASASLSGSSVFYITVDTKEDNGLYNPKTLKSIARLTDFMDERYDKVIGYDNFIRKSHQEMNGGDPSFYEVPDSSDLIAQYSLTMNPESLERFVDFDFRQACLVIRSNIGGSRELNQSLPEIQAFIDNNLSRDLDVHITGESILIAKASDTISREIIFSIGYMLVAIFLLISALFLSLKAGLLAMIPNVMPILVIFGIMGFMGIPISASTFPVAVIALGIAVDDTIHFMVRFSKEMKKTTSNEKAIAQTIAHELRPVFSTSTALCLGYVALMFAQFGSISQFGFLSAITMLMALIGDLLLTPAILITNPLITSWDVMRLKINPELFKTSTLFRGLSGGQIKRVALMGTMHDFKEGDSLLQQGEEGRFMYLILSGNAEVQVTDDNGSTRILEKIKDGNIVGEMAFLTGDTRSANVVASSPIDALKIDARTLERVSKRLPYLAIKIYQNLSGVLTDRLQATTKNFVAQQK